MRPSGRAVDELRQISLELEYTCHAEGAVQVSFGNTRVLCTASVESGVPRFLKGQKQGWLTAEYGMLPRSTGTRMAREASRGKQGGRTLEISRLIGRSLRSCVDLTALGENTITIDCDVIQADGGTRTAAITGGQVALVMALHWMQREKKVSTLPLNHWIASVSAGVYQGEAVLDLDYAEDSNAETDMNLVMTEHGTLIEVQGTAEGKPFTPEELNSMLALGRQGIATLIGHQRSAVSSWLKER